jgi:hypothetical protein
LRINDIEGNHTEADDNAGMSATTTRPINVASGNAVMARVLHALDYWLPRYPINPARWDHGKHFEQEDQCPYGGHRRSQGTLDTGAQSQVTPVL